MLEVLGIEGRHWTTNTVGFPGRSRQCIPIRTPRAPYSPESLAPLPPPPPRHFLGKKIGGLRTASATEGFAPTAGSLLASAAPSPAPAQVLVYLSSSRSSCIPFRPIPFPHFCVSLPDLGRRKKDQGGHLRPWSATPPHPPPAPSHHR